MDVRKSSIKLLEKNLTKVVNAVHGSNEIWYRIYPPPPLECYFKDNVSNSERTKIDNVEEVVLYVHVPFCKNRCDYCGLHGACDIEKIGSKTYIDCLKKELENILKINKKRKILSMLIGGGTPSLLAPADLKGLMNYIRKNFDIPRNAQLSIEVAPADVTSELAKSIVGGGINRVCLGVQTFNEKKLKFCNRQFQRNIDVYNAVKNLREAGLRNISFDLIYGLESGESVDDFLNDNLGHISKLQPTGIALYPLQHYKKFPRSVTDFPSKNLRLIRKVIDSELKKRGAERSGFDNLPQRGSYYWFLRRYLLKDVVPIGLGAKGDYWINGRFIEKFNRRNRKNDLWGYKQDIENNRIVYIYSGLSREESLRKHVIHGLGPRGYGIYESVVQEKFDKSLGLFHGMMDKIKDVLNSSGGRISLRDDYEKVLPFKTKNKEVNYFIFSFCYLYSESNQEVLLKNIGV